MQYSVRLCALMALCFAIGCAEGRFDPVAEEAASLRTDTHDHGEEIAEKSRRGHRSCGTRPVGAEELAEIQREVDNHFRNQPSQRRKQTVNVPVYFHVIEGQNGQGKVSNAAVKAQIRTLNRAYAGSEFDGRTKFKFKLKKTTRTRNALWHAACDHHQVEKEMKTALRRGGKNALNIYACTPGDLLGFATWPWEVKNARALDGVVIATSTLPNPRASHPFNEGDTLVHEVGHWMGLYHTFQGVSVKSNGQLKGCGGKGDRVRDTPAHFVNYTCAQTEDTCRGGGVDPHENYMNYTHDVCMDRFSRGQAQRMDQHVRKYRL